MITHNEVYVSKVAKWEQTRWLVLSSLFFSIPSIYAYYHKMYSLCVLLNMTSIISANYWRKATFSWRRNLDLIFAKFSFVVFSVHGYLYIKTPFYVATGYSSFFVILYLYYLSEIYMKRHDVKWVSFHFLFHLLLIYEEYIILHSMVENQKNKNIL